ncbi:piggyBac transposable element-derived protein 4 [Trichonephila clavipes]|nr:piggyBac transposable element-derived protein 4 [Trichonephila clavipes]
MHRCPTRRVFSGTGLEPVTKQATVRYLYHSATAASDYVRQVALATTTGSSMINDTCKSDKRKDDTEEEVPYPKAVAVYNGVVGEVDRFDQRKERYQLRRSVKRWHSIFYFLIDLAIINNFILWQVNKRSRSLNQLVS